MKKFKASNPIFDPPESIKNRREDTLRVFGLTGLKADTIRIMTETFFKAGMDRQAELSIKLDKGDMSQDEMDTIIEIAKEARLKSFMKGGDKHERN